MCYWFDPSAGADGQWQDLILDISQPRWYPTAAPFVDGATSSTKIIALGGTKNGPLGGCSAIFPNWWTLDEPYQNVAWIDHSGDPQDPYAWHWYPRLVQLSTEYMLHSFDVQVDGCPVLPELHDEPSRRLDPFTDTLTTGPDPEEDDTVKGDPNGAPNPSFKSRYYGNSAIMHTLKQPLSWPAEPADIPAVLAKYDRDRVLAYGGANGNVSAPTIFNLQELVNAKDPNPANWYWREKAYNPPGGPGRLYGNLVLLPDGTVLVVGGQIAFNAIFMNDYFNAPMLFDPKYPAHLGMWTAMATRPLNEFNNYVPRGYHSWRCSRPPARWPCSAAIPSPAIHRFPCPMTPRKSSGPRTCSRDAAP